jgi:hypothetical protein
MCLPMLALVIQSKSGVSIPGLCGPVSFNISGVEGSIMEKFVCNGCDYSFDVRAGGDVLDVYNVHGEMVAQAGFDHGVEQLFCEHIDPDDGERVEFELSFFEFIDKPRYDLAYHLAATLE